MATYHDRALRFTESGPILTHKPEKIKDQMKYLPINMKTSGGRAYCDRLLNTMHQHLSVAAASPTVPIKVHEIRSGVEA